MTSLIAGIASGTPAQARRLAGRGGLALLILWVISSTLVFVSPLALPPDKGGAFYATTTTLREAPIDWLDLVHPVESVPITRQQRRAGGGRLLDSSGIALLGIDEKSRIVSPLRLVSETLGRASTLLVNLAPFGIFAIAGNAAGTLRVEQFERLQAFFLIWIGLSSILALWILPGLIALVTGINDQRIMSAMWPSLVTAFITSNLFIVLPVIQERAKELLAERHRDPDAAGNVDVLVPTSFTFPHAAKLLSLSFVLFAGWFAGAPVPPSRMPTLVGAGITAVPLAA